MKQTCVVSCPIDTYSGYGSIARDFVKSLIISKGDEWDIKILSQRWGNTPYGYLEAHNETDLSSRIIPQLTHQPDIWFQITVPNEFQKIGKVKSIGVTAGMETTLCHHSWIEGCNRMDLVIVPSQHAKKTLEDSVFSQQDPNTKQIVGELKIQVPIEVVFYGIKTDVYKKVTPKKITLDEIPEDFCFLHVGMWTQGDIGHDRKDIGMTIKVFLEVFKNRLNPPALILKTGGASASILDKEGILDRIDFIRKSVRGTLPNIYLVHGDLLDEEVNELYNNSKVKAMVSFTKGEGFGNPLLEFSLTGKPIITSNWSGHLDFLDPDHNFLINGKVEQIHASAAVENIIVPESSWFTIDYTEAGQTMDGVYKKYTKSKEKSTPQADKNREKFSFEKMTELVKGIMDNTVPKVQPLVLPKLKKIEFPKINK